MPTICVGPVRSHCSPIRISPFCCAKPGPVSATIAATPVVNPIKLVPMRLMMVPPPYSRCLVRKRPHPEVVADVAPQPVQTLRLDDQEKDDQPAEQNLPQIGYRVEQVALRKEQPAVILEEPAGQDRQQGNEDRA